MTLPENETVSIALATTDLAARKAKDDLLATLLAWTSGKPSASLSAAFLTEDIIGEAGLRVEYVAALEEVVTDNPGLLHFNLAHANAIERGKAYVIMLSST